MRNQIVTAWRESLSRLLFAAMVRASIGLSIVFVVTVVASVGLSLAFVVAVGSLIGHFKAAVHGGAGSAAAATEWRAIVVLAAILLVQQVTAAVQRVVIPRLGRAVDGQVRVRVMAAALAPQDVEHLQDPEIVSDVAAATTVGTARFGPWGAVEAFNPVITSLLTGAAMAALICRYRWWLGLLLAGAWLWARRHRRRDSLENWRVLGTQSIGTQRQAYFRQMGVTPDAAKEIRVFGLAGWLRGSFHQHWLDVMSSFWVEREGRRPSLALVLAVLVSANVIAVITIVDMARDGLGLGAVTVLFQAVLGCFSFTDYGPQTVNEIIFAFGAATLRGVDHLVDRLGSLPLAAQPIPERRSPSRAITFEEVGFAYRNGHRVFEQLDLEIPIGRSLAIVGANGAGKTTLVRMLAGLLHPTEGRVLLDDTDLGDVDSEWWRAHLGVVFQDFTRFLASARDNVRFGACELSISDQDLEWASSQIGLDEVISELRDGWETPLSRQLAGGSDLSGGQWQRVALARALLAIRGGASVLVLDEPTANLDVRAEADFYRRFLELTNGLTTVVISHRFATVRQADTICVLDSGRVSEMGSHAELISRNGLYARLFALQSEGFAESSGADRD
jgi:ATP-binding cassette subfamily B protein